MNTFAITYWPEGRKNSRHSLLCKAAQTEVGLFISLLKFFTLQAKSLNVHHCHIGGFPVDVDFAGICEEAI